MITPPASSMQAAYQHWLDAAKLVLSYQWQWFDVQYRAGFQILEATLTASARAGTQPAPAPTIEEKTQELERIATERLKQGLAPPREIYQLPYRARIDWGRFPEWARPNDPELYDGCVHEG